jgi:drug/metabolite transporter (DMT)-like permease
MMAQMMVGINIVGSKYLVQDMPVLMILFIRFSIASAFLYLIHCCVADQKSLKLATLNRRDWQYIFAQALCAGVLFNFFLLLGLHYTEASVAGIITSVLPAIIAVLSVIFLKERLNLFSVLCIMFAISGLLIINAPNFAMAKLDGLLGDAIILLSLLPEAAYYVLAKIYDNKLPLFFAATLMNAINLPFLLIALLIGGHWQVQFTLVNSSILLIAGISSGLFYVFWFWGCKQVKGSVAGLFTAFMPVATLIVAWIGLGERITLLQTIGMILVMTSVIFNAKRDN